MPTKIEWCDETWNPITGCTQISEGCANCYAKRMIGRKLHGYDFTPQFHRARLEIPYHWRKPRRIFVGSMGDVFHKDQKIGNLIDILRTVLNNPEHTFMFLTKRPERCLELHNSNATFFEMWSRAKNLWLGVSAENQKRYDERVPILTSIPVVVHFVSIEPMLEPINMITSEAKQIPGVDWVIAGPENGPGKRECRPEWIDDLWCQCKVASVPFFDKRPCYIERGSPASGRMNNG